MDCAHARMPTRMFHHRRRFLREDGCEFSLSSTVIKRVGYVNLGEP